MSIPKHIIEHEEIGLDDDYFKLDQTTPQEVDNGIPKFKEGLEITKDKFIILNQ